MPEKKKLIAQNLTRDYQVYPGPSVVWNHLQVEEKNTMDWMSQVYSSLDEICFEIDFSSLSTSLFCNQILGYYTLQCNLGFSPIINEPHNNKATPTVP